MNMRLSKIIRGKNRPHSRRGIALIFTLGILGLLTVLALGFASTAMINRKVAHNTANRTAAQLLAQSALERVRFALNSTDFSEDKIYSRPYGSVSDTGSEFNNGDYDWLWKLHTDSDGVNLYTFPDNYSTSTKGLPAWQYVKGPNGEIIGRFAYVVKTEKGKLDPSVHFGEKIFPPTPDPDYETPDGPSGKLLRKGKNEAEIDFVNYNSSDTDLQDWQGKMKTELAKTERSTEDSGNREYLDKLGRFADIADLAKVLGVTAQTAKDKLNERFEFRSSPDPEAFWLDRNGNGKIDKEEYHHRFNLGARLPYTRSGGVITGSQWDSMKVDDLLKDAKLYSETVVTSSETDANEPDTGGIPWLNNWKYASTTSSAWTSDLMKKQIAANIIQYCRQESSDTVTNLTGVTASNWIANTPEYAGVGRHPMLNEIGLVISVGARVTLKSETSMEKTWTCCYDITIGTGAELIDMFYLPTKKNIKLKALAKFSLEYNAAGTWKPWSTTDAITLESSFTGDTADTTMKWTNGYTAKNSFWFAEQTVESESFDLTAAVGTDVSALEEQLKVRNVTFELKKIILEYGGKPRDIAVFNTTFNTGKDETGKDEYSLQYETSTSSFRKKNFFQSCQTDDPRVNHYATDWDCPPITVRDADAAYTGYYMDEGGAGTEGRNSNVVTCQNTSDTDKQDLETKDNPAATKDDPAATSASDRLSTAYIRHAPMESLWELGAISRAEKWKTLNLTKTDTTNSKLGQANGGGGEYKDGDGAILDQVKLTSKIASYGKVNLNTDSHRVLHALFTNVKVGQDAAYSDYNAGDNYSLTSHDAITADCLPCKIASISTHTPLKTRAELLAAGQTHKDSNVQTLLGEISAKLLQPSSTASATDAEREQLIGKVINLTKADATNEINVVILAQTIKDIGPETGTIAVQKYWGKTKDQRYRRAGYLRSPRQTETNPKWTKITPPSSTDLDVESILLNDKKRGEYKNGADQITGEAKLVVIMYKDNGIWRIRRYEYAE